MQADGSGQLAHAQAAEHTQRRAGPHAGDPDQLAKGIAFFSCCKTKQHLGVFSHHKMGQQRDLGAHRWQIEKRAHGHIDLIAHAMAIDQNLGRILFQQNTG